MPIRKLILAGLAFLIMPAFAQAQTQKRVDLRKNATEIIRQLAPIDFSKIKTTATGKSDPQLDLFAKALGLSPRSGDSLGLMQKSLIPKTSLTSYRFQQNYHGIPIWGESIVLTQHADKSIRHLSGFVITNTKIKIIEKPDENAKISRKKALQLAQLKTTKKSVNFDNESTQLVIYIDPDSSKSTPAQPKLARLAKLAWEVSFFVMIDNKPSHPVYLIDADNGTILNNYDNLQDIQGSGPESGSESGSNKKTGCRGYGKGKTPSLGIIK